jgi:hypothetical protein
VSALHVCLKCRGGCWSIEREDRAVTALCLLCGTRVHISDGRREAAEAELAAVRGHGKPGPKPKVGGG